MDFDIKRVFIFIGSALIIFLAVYQIFGNVKEKDDEKMEGESDKVVFEIEKSDDLDLALYYEGEHNYYLYGLKEVMVTYQNEKKSLKEYLNTGESIEELVDGFVIAKANDGGSILYKGDVVNVLVCHRSLDNNTYNEDIYVGAYDMEYEEGFCE